MDEKECDLCLDIKEYFDNIIGYHPDDSEGYVIQLMGGYYGYMDSSLFYFHKVSNLEEFNEKYKFNKQLDEDPTTSIIICNECTKKLIDDKEVKWTGLDREVPRKVLTDCCDRLVNGYTYKFYILGNRKNFPYREIWYLSDVEGNLEKYYRTDINTPNYFRNGGIVCVECLMNSQLCYTKTEPYRSCLTDCDNCTDKDFMDTSPVDFLLADVINGLLRDVRTVHPLRKKVDNKKLLNMLETVYQSRIRHKLLSQELAKKHYYNLFSEITPKICKDVKNLIISHIIKPIKIVFDMWYFEKCPDCPTLTEDTWVNECHHNNYHVELIIDKYVTSAELYHVVEKKFSFLQEKGYDSANMEYYVQDINNK